MYGDDRSDDGTNEVRETTEWQIIISKNSLSTAMQWMQNTQTIAFRPRPTRYIVEIMTGWCTHRDMQLTSIYHVIIVVTEWVVS